MMSTLKVGPCRYGVMCGVDGMVIDDGTVLRPGEDRFLVTTTTGNAAKVLDWMEEWLQTEWPRAAGALHLGHRAVGDLRRSSARARATCIGALVAPAGRLERGVSLHDLAGHRGGGHARRGVCRISFSGELAFEINVSAWHGLALWEALLEAGRRYGITPYGTETMHVLRAEKGYPIIGQDTDGTVTPQDLGLAWVVSKKKPDFVGKRSFARAENRPADRKQLVGLLPVDRRTRCCRRARSSTSPPRSAAAAGADARARHLELPQRRPRTTVRARPGANRARPDRRDAARLA